MCNSNITQTVYCYYLLGVFGVANLKKKNSLPNFMSLYLRTERLHLCVDLFFTNQNHPVEVHRYYGCMVPTFL